jgi:predicted amidohydrolase
LVDPLKVAAYQAPLSACASVPEAIELIREQVERCESASVEILCCPEGMLGGLADYASEPKAIAISSDGDRLNAILAPLKSDTVTTIVGFTETDRRGRLYNTAAVFYQGSVIGLYRKTHPAIRKSVYAPGDQCTVFTCAALTFGILICNDSNYPELARLMKAQGAAALFIPTNNGLPPARTDPGIIAEVRNVDIGLAAQNHVSIIRADVAGRIPGLISYGSSGIVGRDGLVLASAQLMKPDLLVAEICVT